jgi:hypothetical protein
MVIGPFPLGTGDFSDEIVPPGFDKVYPPEQEIDFTASYERVISEKWSLIGTYYLGLNFNQSPTTYASIQHVLLIGGKLKF